jgi:hypothetical protein
MYNLGYKRLPGKANFCQQTIWGIWNGTDPYQHQMCASSMKNISKMKWNRAPVPAPTKMKRGRHVLLLRYIYIYYIYFYYFYSDKWVAFGFLLKLGDTQRSVLAQMPNDVKGDVAHRTCVASRNGSWFMKATRHVLDSHWLCWTNDTAMKTGNTYEIISDAGCPT